MAETRQRPRAFTVRLFLPDGDPDGVKVIEKSNWTGSGVVVPRSLFADSRKRSEFARTGVYLLVGPDETSQLPRLYIGEGDPIGPRLDSHAKGRDFWTHLIGFTSKDQNLHKAHIQYLESRLIEQAKAAKRCVLDNTNSPQLPSLSEADKAEVEGFLADVLLCLPVLGYGFFDPEPAPAESAQSRQEYSLHSKGVSARGYESSKGFVVLHGSQAVKKEVTSIHPYMSELRRSLIEQSLFIDEGTHYKIAQDYAFNSPSTAAGVVLGRTANGRIEWKTEDGRTLKSIQNAEVGE